jgi:hypothetical protein
VLSGKAWVEEITRTVAASGLPWRVSSVWVEQSGRYCADLTDVRTGKGVHVSLEAERFSSPADRRAEITRQLDAHQRR